MGSATVNIVSVTFSGHLLCLPLTLSLLFQEAEGKTNSQKKKKTVAFAKQLLISQLFILQQHQGQCIDKLEESVYFCNMLIFPGIKADCNPFV